ncbi:cupin domain-containing protein [Halalkalibacter krulwichiae]|uniref:Gentisate 1,2-dioxygenase n=1 Tax=Halalkalibacter krulwichiae TaxID=199441 RepID=A0A1X9MGM1_9BACI|nr:cupin domain-containing protein [Halalkalibacter krulwichiae]ARK32607.1 Gentisate 1,2-dioxygenase [Halalkalibacter krulwichiae]
MAEQKVKQKWTPELLNFHDELDELNLGPLWASVFSKAEPESKAIPYMWKKDLILKKLEKAKELLQVGTGSIDRRAVYLINPGMKDMQPHGWGGATQTLYAAVQVLNPGEVAPSHRHMTSAQRFIIEGQGASGTVNGVKYNFEPGDFVVTPAWTWHDHKNEGTEPVIWMDALDIPFCKGLGTFFFEKYPEETQPINEIEDLGVHRYKGGMVRPITDRKPSPAPLGSYKWDLTKQSLDGLEVLAPDPFDGHTVEYINPSNGQDANGRVGARMTKLPVGFEGKAHRHAHSCIYHVYKGSGYTVINGTKFEWEAGDFIALPGWAWHEHVNTSTEEEALLFSTNDLPLMEMLGFEREEAYQDYNGRQEIAKVFQPILP